MKPLQTLLVYLVIGSLWLLGLFSLVMFQWNTATLQLGLAAFLQLKLRELRLMEDPF